MMQQQAALMAATQGSYLNPMAAIAAAQMQQMAAFNVNGLVATPMTPSSGTPCDEHTENYTRTLIHCTPIFVRTFINIVDYDHTLNLALT